MGFGDYLLVTALANNINKQKQSRVRYTRKKYIVGDDSQLGQGIMIKNNPKFYQIENLYKSGPITHISREKHHYNLDSNEHQIIQMCKKAGIKNNIILKPELYLTDEEFKNVNNKLKKINKPFIVLEPFSKKINDEFFNILKKFTNYYKDKIQIVQVGSNKKNIYDKKNSKNRDKINNLGKDIITLNGKLSIRETIYLIQNSICFIGIEGALVHGLASDIFYKKENKLVKIENKSKGIIFLGGQMNPKSVMYPQFEYIILDPHKGKYCGKLGLMKKEKGKCEKCCKMFKKYKIEIIYDKVDRIISK